MDGQYLRVTIHDNDFTTALQDVCKQLQSIFISEHKFPDENDLDSLKDLIAHMWYAIHEIDMYMRWKNTPIDHEIRSTDEYKCYFLPNLSIVKYEDIPEWDNWESCYIPLFEYHFDSGIQPDIITV